MANLVSVYNTRNSKRIFEYEEGSYTHKQAVAGNGGWRLANPEQVEANEVNKKKIVGSVEDEKPQNPIPSNEGENAEGAEGEQAQEQEKGEEIVNDGTPQAPASEPKKEGKPKAAGAKKNQTKEGK